MNKYVEMAVDAIIKFFVITILLLFIKNYVAETAIFIQVMSEFDIALFSFAGTVVFSIRLDFSERKRKKGSAFICYCIPPKDQNRITRK